VTHHSESPAKTLRAKYTKTADWLQGTAVGSDWKTGRPSWKALRWESSKVPLRGITQDYGSVSGDGYSELNGTLGVVEVTLPFIFDPDFEWIDIYGFAYGSCQDYAWAVAFCNSPSAEFASGGVAFTETTGRFAIGSAWTTVQAAAAANWTGAGECYYAEELRIVGYWYS
jgi:hypothetical protein